MKSNSKTILYVDDDADDREIVSDVIHSADPAVNVVTANNGIEALNYLYASVQDGAGLPCLVVLDLNMPYLDGHETYQRLKSEQSFNSIPVMILTSSGNPSDKKHYAAQGVRLMTKPSDMQGLEIIASSMLGACR